MVVGMTTNTNGRYRIALIRPDGTSLSKGGYVTFAGAGRKRTIEVEDISGLGILKREGYTLDFGEDATGHEAAQDELTRAGWKVAR